MESKVKANHDRDISSQWLRALVESALDGVITIDDSRRIISLNPAAEKIFGYRRDRAIGERLTSMVAPLASRSTYEKELTWISTLSTNG